MRQTNKIIKLFLRIGLSVAIALTVFFLRPYQGIAEQNSSRLKQKNVFTKIEFTEYMSRNESSQENVSMSIEIEPRVLIKNGTVGTVDWTFDDAGVLTFAGGAFDDAFNWYLWNTDIKSDIKKVVFTEPIVVGNSLSSFFADMIILTEVVDLSYLDTRNTVTMAEMFENCQSLVTVDVSGLNTSKVNSMRRMFGDSPNLVTLDLSAWDTSSVTNFNAMFIRCTSLEFVDVSNFNTSNIVDAEHVFNSCTSLTTLDVSNWDTTNMKYVRSLFYNCNALTALDVSNWNTSKFNDGANMFQGCESLLTLDVSLWDTSKMRTLQSMFSGCRSLTSLDVSNWDTALSGEFYKTFDSCENLETIDVSNWDTTSSRTSQDMFRNCTKLTSLDVSNWNTTRFNSMHNMFFQTPIQEITLGADFRFVENASYPPTNLNQPLASNGYTGKWEYLETGELITHQELLEYDGTKPGTYRWQKAKYLVDFDLNGGARPMIESVEIEFEQLINQPVQPIREEFSFVEWTIDREGTEPWDFLVDTMPFTPLTLYAQWVQHIEPITPPMITDDGGPFTMDECGTIRDRWGNIMHKETQCKAPMGYVVPKTGSKEDLSR